jgi:uncharacterized DUF497 family protein
MESTQGIVESAQTQGVISGASTVFDDRLSVTKPDPDHSGQESRYLTLGLSFKHRLILVAHTDDPDEIRIISARLPTPNERDVYEND